ncbi:MAG: serine acetyltransferase [Magnetococcales bacterium]|nr:serine acetyltransferase [Magnetococcales bacterium]
MTHSAVLRGPGFVAPTTHWELERVVDELRQTRAQWRQAHHRNTLEEYAFPSRGALARIVTALATALYPMRLGPSHVRKENEDFYVGLTLDTALTELLQQVRIELTFTSSQSGVRAGDGEQMATGIIQRFAAGLPEVRRLIDLDVDAAYHGDPAAHSVDEVLLCYPGVIALLHYRFAHALFCLGVPLLARAISELAHAETGIDIHPGAHIAGSFFIDHGTGVVIGETAIIGEHVRIYQAVTLGAKSFPRDGSGRLKKGAPRHPIIEDHVVIYAGATLLGRITIGRGSTIGGNVWLTHSVPPNSHVTQANTQQEHNDGSGI